MCQDYSSFECVLLYRDIGENVLRVFAQWPRNAQVSSLLSICSAGMQSNDVTVWIVFTSITKVIDFFLTLLNLRRHWVVDKKY